MYTVGYLQTYGVALLVASAPGLAAAAFSQAAIIAFYRLVERPHHQRLYGGAAPAPRRVSTSEEPGRATPGPAPRGGPPAGGRHAAHGGPAGRPARAVGAPP